MGETEGFFLSLKIINKSIPVFETFFNIFKALGIKNVFLRYKFETLLLLAFLW